MVSESAPGVVVSVQLVRLALYVAEGAYCFLAGSRAWNYFATPVVSVKTTGKSETIPGSGLPSVCSTDPVLLGSHIL